MMNGGSGSSDHQGAVDWSVEDELNLINFLNDFQDTEELGTTVDAPTINQDYPNQPIMCTMNVGSNLSGGSSKMAHGDDIHGCMHSQAGTSQQIGTSQQTMTASSLIPNKSTTMSVRSGQTSAATKLITVSLGIKNPKDFLTRDAWHEYSLRKVQKLKEEYYNELLSIHQNTVKSRNKAKHFKDVNKHKKVREVLEALMMFMNIRSVDEFPRDDYMIYDYLTNIVTHAHVIRRRNNNNNFHKTHRRSHVPPKSSQSVCPSFRRPSQSRTRNSTSVNNGSLKKRPVNTMRASSSNTPLSSASPVETQKLKTPIQETPNSKNPLLHLVDVVQPMSSKSMVSAIYDINYVQMVIDSLPECQTSGSTNLQNENEPQRKIRRTLNVSAHHDQILSDEWDIDFLETTMNMKPNDGIKGLLLDEIKAINLELLETSLVVVLDTADEYVRILGSQRGTIVKCLYANVCFPDFCGPQKIPDFLLEIHVPMDYPNSTPKIFNSGRNILSQPWKKLCEDILTRFDLSLGEIHGKISLADLARKWDKTARFVITEFVEGIC